MGILAQKSLLPLFLLLIWRKNFYPHFPYWFNDSHILLPSQKYFEFPARGKFKIFVHSREIQNIRTQSHSSKCLNFFRLRENSYICKNDHNNILTKCLNFPACGKILTFAKPLFQNILQRSTNFCARAKIQRWYKLLWMFGKIDKLI